MCSLLRTYLSLLYAVAASGNIEDERQRGIRTRRFKRFGSKEWKEGIVEMGDGKVNESFVVVKRSVDPCQDFKKSMVEMIVEKHMFEPKELENLLMTFLSLNSRTHHRAILKAFTEIWKELFSGSST
ncbi:hypothetical protein ACS0TY_035620 [Phlomoides rotata]